MANWNQYLLELQQNAFWNKPLMEYTGFDILIMITIASIIYLIISGELDL